MIPEVCGVHAHEHNLVPCSLENLDVGDCLKVLDIENIDREYRCSTAFTWYKKIHDALEDSHNQYHVTLNGTFQD